MAERNPDETLVWVDIETNDLAPSETGRILEVGFKVTDLDFNILTGIKAVVGMNDLEYVMDNTSDYVLDMHNSNNLWSECREQDGDIFELQSILMNWVDDEGIAGHPLAGSSLKLDRDFLQFWTPELHAKFHYRSIDNSSTKELCRRYNPDLYAQLPESETNHRVFTCLDGTISEAKFYADNFLMQGGE